MKDLEEKTHDFFEGQLEPTRLYTEEFGDFKKKEIVFNSSKILNLAKIIVPAIIISIFYLFVKFYLNQNYVENKEIKISIEAVSIFLFLIASIHPIIYLFKNGSLLTINTEGITIKKNLILWNNIIGTYIEKRFVEDSDDYYLFIKCKNQNYRIPLEYSKLGIKKINHMIETFKILNQNLTEN
ncbi:MAG: hypothetical protein JXR51_04410 [Bacteroidales bacterium]|nr:hypothetical protein [Bacteroidales bacterium]